jgi:hypothetical protein
MVKRCGKSAPRSWQHGWQAKPRTEQGQIGKREASRRSSERRGVSMDGPSRLPGRLLDPASNGGARGMIVAPKSAVAPPARVALWRDEGGQNSAYGRLRRPLDEQKSTLVLADDRPRTLPAN